MGGETVEADVEPIPVDRDEALREYVLRSNQTIERMLDDGIITIEQAEQARSREFDFAHDILFTTPESRSDG